MKTLMHFAAVSLRASILVASVVGLSRATALRVTPWPLTINPHASIEVGTVQVEKTQYSEWLERLQEQNPVQLHTLTIEPVAKIGIRVMDDESGVQMKQLEERARVEAAWAGANLVCLEKSEAGSKGKFATANFVAYRVKHQNELVSAGTLTTLATTPTPLLAQVPVRVEEPRWIKNAQDKEAILSFLHQLDRGARVRVQLDNGTAVQGKFSGVDDDNRIWVNPQGIKGLWTDHAVKTEDIQIVALLQ